MRKAKVTVPAVCVNLGPGIESLGLALSLHLTVSFIERSDSELVIETHGEDSDDIAFDCFHPVMYAAIRVFQQVEEAPVGLRIDVRSAIPFFAGLGARDAMTVAGLVGANSLMGNPLDRDTLIRLGEDILGRADGVIAAMLGGLTISAAGGETGPLYHRVDVPPLKVLVILPQLEDYDPDGVAIPAQLAMPDALFNLGRQALVVEALREGDYDLLQRALADHVLTPALLKAVPGFEAARQSALDAGAVGVSISGQGPSMLVFALANHYRIADAVQSVFDEYDILSRVWTLTVDTQGVVVTAAETLPPG